MSAKLPAHEIWWRLFTGRVAQIEAQIATKEGALQFEVARGKGERPHYFFLKFADGRALFGDGIITEPRVWIETSEGELAQLIDGEPKKGALRAMGDTEFFEQILKTMANAAVARTALGIQTGGPAKPAQDEVDAP